MSAKAPMMSKIITNVFYVNLGVYIGIIEIS